MHKKDKWKIVNAIHEMILKVERVHEWTQDEKKRLSSPEKDKLIIEISKSVNTAFLGVLKSRHDKANETAGDKIKFELLNTDLTNGSK